MWRLTGKNNTDMSQTNKSRAVKQTNNVCESSAAVVNKATTYEVNNTVVITLQTVVILLIMLVIHGIFVVGTFGFSNLMLS